MRPCPSCIVTNLEREPTVAFHKSRSTSFKAPRKCADSEADVVTFGTKERLGGRYALVVVILTGSDAPTPRVAASLTTYGRSL